MVSQLEPGALVASLTREHFDVLVCPGGSHSSPLQAADLEGRAAIRRFVGAGGGYVGVCGGAWLAQGIGIADVEVGGHFEYSQCTSYPVGIGVYTELETCPRVR